MSKVREAAEVKFGEGRYFQGIDVDGVMKEALASHDCKKNLREWLISQDHELIIDVDKKLKASREKSQAYKDDNSNEGMKIKAALKDEQGALNKMKNTAIAQVTTDESRMALVEEDIDAFLKETEVSFLFI